ncbi:ankyrin repeat domain-containing protein 31-like [Kryptolebias marmoratus]|uniref:ankyrin repeat domain-containing protein 31-like n=1 Tax=Kryptolebias marmoratus TaxID=37003 RepID=UPI000D52FC58|nr:ankyrin repeat domain-containing protein 31-like [Kryptolebias marmoratus]
MMDYDDAEVVQELSCSDQDSLSLLQDLPARQSRDAAEDGAATDPGAKTGNKETENKINLNQRKRKQPEKAAAASSSSANVKIKTSKFIHKRNGKGETHLHRACRKNDLALVKMLIQAGISVNEEDNAGWTALHEASGVGAEAVVEELLKAGAMVNARSCNGVTPLHDAVALGNYQVVKLLLQNGSNPSDRDVGGRSALDLAAEENLKDLLRTYQTSPVTLERPCEEAAESTQPVVAALNPESRVVSGASGVSNTTNLRSGESRGGGGAKEPNDAGFDYSLRAQSHSMTVAAVLEDMRTKQTETSAWPLRDLKDAEKYRAAITQIQSVLTYILEKQRSEKENLARKYRTVPDHFHQPVLKSQLLSLASCQRNLVEILQKQTQLEEAYVSAKAKMSHHSSTLRGDVLKRQLPGDGFTQESSAGLLKPGETSSCRQCRERSGSCRPVRQAKGRNAPMQTSAEDNGRCLHRLVQAGVLTPGSGLQLTLKGKQHTAHMRADGSIISKGKLHQAPERWLESILGNNIPVSSAYALDKVTFRDKPLSHYFLNMEAEENGSRADSAQQEPTPGAGNLYQMLKNIKIVRLVSDDEFLPSATMDYYWDKLLKQTPSQFEDWDTEL